MDGLLDEAAAEALLRRAVSVLISAPDSRFYACLPLIRRALLELPAIEARRGLARFCDHAAATPEPALAAHHARTFDGRRRTLHLLDHAEGDARWRRRVRARIAEAYAARGRRISGDEHPDHLAVVLEFAACADPDRGERLLVRLRPGLERLRSALAELGTPYAAVLDAVCATLPPPESSAARRPGTGGRRAAGADGTSREDRANGVGGTRGTRHIPAVPRQAGEPDPAPSHSGARTRFGAAGR